MKSFTAVLLTASASLAAAQFGPQPTLNPDTGRFSCPVPNGVYCAGESLGTNIIIRCTDGVGYPGNCNDNLAGYPPMGVKDASCWASTTEAGVGACAKNCLVQGPSGNYNGVFNYCALSSSSTTVEPTTTITYGPTSTSEPVTTECSTSYPSTVTYISTEECSTSTAPPTTIPTFTINPTGTGAGTTFIIVPTGGGNGGNVTNPTSPTTTGEGSSPTATPVGPTKSATATFVPTSGAGKAGMSFTAIVILAAGVACLL